MRKLLIITLCIVATVLSVSCVARIDTPASQASVDTATTSEDTTVASVTEAVVEPDAPTQATVAVDGTTASGSINRKLFSLVNQQGILQYAGALAERSYLELNTTGAQQRIATNPLEFEPENDNDDPMAIEWSNVYPEYLFAGNAFMGDELVDHIIASGEEPLLLLAYNLPWISKSGAVTDPPTDFQEWAEFAVAAVQSINGTDPTVPPKVTWVEIWNEPDTNLYWNGTRQQYYEFFNIVADRIHAECPGVKVGGPAAVNGTSQWTIGFIDACAERMDAFIYHSYGETVEAIIGKAKNLHTHILNKTGKKIPLIITETDNINMRGPAKADYIMQRQFALLDEEISSYFEAFHHFQARGYQEGDRKFGLVEDDGSVVSYNYWPYWMFRDLRGERAAITIDEEAQTAGLLGIASVAEESMSTVLYLPTGSKQMDIAVTLQIPEALSKGMVVISHMQGDVATIQETRSLQGERELKLPVLLSQQEAITITIRTQPPANPIWASLVFDKDGALAGETLKASLTATNLGTKALTGKFSLLGTPSDWKIAPSVPGSDQVTLEPGATKTLEFEVKTLGTTPQEGSAVYAFASLRATGERPIRITSIPIRLRVLAPVAMRAIPLRNVFAPSETRSVAIEITNTFSVPVAGTIQLSLPEGFSSSAPQEISLALGESRVVNFTVQADAATPTGTFSPSIVFDYNTIPYKTTFDLPLLDYSLDRKSTPVDLSKYYNADGVTSAPDFADYHDFGARFTMAGEFMPPAGPITLVGIDYIFPDTTKGKDNYVQTLGQVIPLPEGKYSSLALLCTATNSNKKETLTVTYTDGSTQSIEWAVTDWCVDPKNGEIAIYKAPYRHIPEGVLIDAKPQIFHLAYALDPQKSIASLTLPNRNDLFLMALSLVD